MSVSENLTLAEIKRLGLEDRLAVVGEIWESITSAPALLPVTEDEKQYLEEQYRAYQENPTQGKPWDEVEREILSELEGK